MTRKEYNRQYYLKNRKRLLEKHRKHNKIYKVSKQARKKYESKRKRPSHYKLYETNYRLKREYGITLEEKKEIFLKQEGKCWICGKDLVSVYKAHTDHDHTTGIVRGLLCNNCNIGLGCFEDDPKLLQNAIAYLTQVLLDKEGKEG